MSRIEELPDDFDDSLKLNNSQKAAPISSSSVPLAADSQYTPFPIKEAALSQDDTTPSLPPQMASVRSHTADEIVQMMNRTPLFMTSLEDAGEGM